MKMNSPKWKWGRNSVALAITVAVVCGVAACGGSSSGSGASASSAHGQTITIAYTAPVADEILGPVTQAAGLFKKNGVNVDIKFLAPNLAIPALVSGKVQYVFVGAPSAEVAAVNGTPLEYVGEWEHAMDAAIVANRSISTAKDLNGKAIAISSAGALSDFLAQIADHQYGIQMREVPLGAFQDETTAYAHGSTAAISGSNVWQMPQLQAAVPGSHIVVDFRNDHGYPGSGGIIADANWLKDKSNDATTVKVLRALYQGLGYYWTHESVAVKQIETLDSEPASEAKQAYQVVKGAFSDSIVPALADQKNVLTALAWTMPSAAKFNAASLMNATYAKEAMSSAGK
jgi:ABC-type nitrate/sulfonate/bicarbonate transport system substrate-binding protein